MDLPPEMHDPEREAEVDRIIAKFDDLFFKLCERLREEPEDPPEAP